MSQLTEVKENSSDYERLSEEFCPYGCFAKDDEGDVYVLYLDFMRPDLYSGFYK